MPARKCLFTNETRTNWLEFKPPVPYTISYWFHELRNRQVYFLWSKSSKGHIFQITKIYIQTKKEGDIQLSSNNYSYTIEVLDQYMISIGIAPVFDGSWVVELEWLGIQIQDNRDPDPMEQFIVADVAGKLYNGRKHNLQRTMVVVEALLDWTRMGILFYHRGHYNKITSSLNSLLVNDLSSKKIE